MPPCYYRYAGRLTHMLFDKTGTLTTDELIARGVVVGGAPAAPSGGGDGPVGKQAAPRPLCPMAETSAEMCCVIGGCHALLQARALPCAIQMRSATAST